jgi:hypothetical protein
MQSRTRFSTFPRKEDDMSWFQNKANARMKAAKEAETLITLLKMMRIRKLYSSGNGKCVCVLLLSLKDDILASSLYY